MIVSAVVCDTIENCVCRRIIEAIPDIPMLLTFILAIGNMQRSFDTILALFAPNKCLRRDVDRSAIVVYTIWLNWS